MHAGPAIDAQGGGRSGRLLPRFGRFGLGLGLGLFLGLGDELLFVPSQVLLNLRLLLREMVVGLEPLSASPQPVINHGIPSARKKSGCAQTRHLKSRSAIM